MEKWQISEYIGKTCDIYVKPATKKPEKLKNVLELFLWLIEKEMRRRGRKMKQRKGLHPHSSACFAPGHTVALKSPKAKLRVVYSGGLNQKLDIAIEKTLEEFGYKRWASGMDMTNGERDLAFDKKGR